MEGPGHVTDAERRLDAQVARLAAQQHAVVALWQLRALGISERAVIGQTFELTRAADAHAAIESRRVIGKTVLLV